MGKGWFVITKINALRPESPFLTGRGAPCSALLHPTGLPCSGHPGIPGCSPRGSRESGHSNPKSRPVSPPHPARVLRADRGRGGASPCWLIGWCPLSSGQAFLRDVSPPLPSLPQLLLRGSSWRSFSSQTDGEARVSRVLREKFPRAAAIRVVDISGGCGAMYEIHIESEEFREKRTVQQHQMVNEALSEEIKSMHGLRIFTSTPKP
ncbi:bolA-like protein 3 [Pezoporus flaviventris]|uniref:bolA-like protein 3 n=1 Tax=Pezoporus flaviventris TaxID=889875 RepID=UPI002AB2CA44|nr:bolA-like protein 3 [Pezoporus flaviventris]